MIEHYKPLPLPSSGASKVATGGEGKEIECSYRF